MLWGDAIGAKCFDSREEYRGRTGVYEQIEGRLPLRTHSVLGGAPELFRPDILYWVLPPKEGSEAPHIRALIDAINLADL